MASSAAELPTTGDVSLLHSVYVFMMLTFSLAVVGVYWTRYRTPTSSGGPSSEYTSLEKGLRRNYLVAYLLAMLADWLQVRAFRDASVAMLADWLQVRAFRDASVAMLADWLQVSFS